MDTPDLFYDEDVSLAKAVLDGDHRAALQRIETLWSQKGPSPDLMLQAIRSSWALGQDVQARKLAQEGVTLWADRAPLWGIYAAILTAFGAVDEAVAAYDRALFYAPEDVRLLSGRNRLRRFPSSGREARRLEATCEDESTSTRLRVSAEFALAAIEDAEGQYDRAFAHYSRGNALKMRGYDPLVTEQRLADQLEFCPDLADLAGAPPAQGPRMVFIGGLPRSGTTLTEQILLRHDQVSTLGEAPDFRLAILDLMRSEQANGRLVADYWKWFGVPGQPLVRNLEALYRQRITERRVETPVLLSKTPLDLSHAGLLRAMLPEARFIALDRHPLDLGLSLFMTDFANGHGFSERLDWIAHMIQLTDQSMRDYAQKLGPVFRIQSLQALIDYPEQQIPQLLDHIGLQMQSACFDPKAAAGAVRTASDLRVRRGINRDGVARWRHYEAHLQPLIEALGRDWIAEWEERDAQAAPRLNKAS
ncbi:sulfotransferase [Thioclava sp. 'Guangxiensis']|uniref:tetratricopeptide repeat-containing sulfotransferase family protein n=1 Tax=Thioclava sp. 'Guangxiensis' TaxID=3149044 RepID=UPI003877CFDE